MPIPGARYATVKMPGGKTMRLALRDGSRTKKTGRVVEATHLKTNASREWHVWLALGIVWCGLFLFVFS